MFKALGLSIFIILLASGCLPWSREKGNGNFVLQDRAVKVFGKVEVSGNWVVVLRDGETFAASIEIDENLQPFVEVDQQGNTLSIQTRKDKRIHPTRAPKLFLTAPAIESIRLSGASKLMTEGELTQTIPILMRVSGAGELDMDLKAPEVKLDISGSGDIDLRGQTRNFWLDISGAGEARCFDLLAEKTNVRISGAGEAQVFASIELTAKVSGAGEVQYKGEPAEVSRKVSGAGSIKQAE